MKTNKKALPLRFDLQFFAETNLTKTGDFAKAQAIDFVERFGSNLSKLIEALGVTRKMPLTNGMTIKTYKSTVTMAADAAVAEGEVIPLSKVQTEVDKTIELTFKKFRKAASVESIQKHGYDQAIVESDEKLLREIQKGVRTDFFGFLATGTGVASAENLQGAFAKAWGQIQVLFEDDAAQTVVFVNPLDIADHLAKAEITVQTSFGLQYIQNFLGADVVIINTSVPQGTVYATAPENIVLAYVEIGGGEIGKAFDFTTEELGLIGVTHDIQKQNLTAETIALSGVKLFAERLDGVVKVSIVPAV
ncbi:hypothetical protein [Robertmurraya kyonggiensis]|uniref:Phage capsid protein n=1 Tax=Robertmurraya kyonggiensis TaxID=1037680 RepID=A0A4U1D0U1_9BACI|nr:hypothetical protein [Robertmurraya kyonggiensis]TKC15684.1 hypothetical protein FA727_16290 [Robertmurraya kyonggiensis]